MFSRIFRSLTLFLAAIATLASSAAFGQAYQINPGDVLRIDVWNEELLSREVLVRPDGHISLPMAGEVDTSNSSPAEVSQTISEALSKYMKNAPQVVVSLMQGAGNKVYVIGKVLQPGEFLLNGQTDVMQALALAGGLNAFADENDIVILRRQADGSQTSIPFEYNRVKTGRDLDKNIILHSRDVVVVP